MSATPADQDATPGRRTPSVTKLIGKQSGTLVKSGARVLEVLEYFCVAMRPLRAVEISDALELPRSSANELLKTLVATGYLCFDKQLKTYFPSFRIVTLGHWLSSFYFGGGQVIDLMRHLNVATGHLVALTIENDGYMQLVGVVEGDADLGYPQVVIEGYKVPLVGTACGSALLMTKDDEQVARAIAKSKGMKREALRDDEIETTLDLIRSFRARGYATSFWSARPDSQSIAVPLPRTQIGVQLVVGFGGLPQEMCAHEAELAQVLIDSVRRFLG
jgi:DNA-binding IclR family transcriptional regulator